jgi:hypothetical protein
MSSLPDAAKSRDPATTNAPWPPTSLKLLQQWSHNPELMTPDDIAEYLRAYQQPGAIISACNDYRAGP